MVWFILISVGLVIFTGLTPAEWKQWWNRYNTEILYSLIISIPIWCSLGAISAESLGRNFSESL